MYFPLSRTDLKKMNEEENIEENCYKKKKKSVQHEKMYV